MRYATNCRHQFKLDNDPRLIPPLLDFVQEAMQTVRVGDAISVRHASVALEEALTNAMYHGNLEFDEKQARDACKSYRDGDEFEMVKVRSEQEPYKSRSVYVGIDISRSKVQFIIRDQGTGFDVDALQSCSQTEHLAELKQRGLTLIQNFMSDVSFNGEGNEIRMTLEMPR
jgi:anti-sigma regulatory factor (Ser/Thr protein kinase)